jgi:hypothetical protein
MREFGGSLRGAVLCGWLAWACAGASCASEDDRPATWSYVWATIIEPSCTTVGCHSSFSATYGFRFDSKKGAYTYLTGRSCDEPDAPGAPPRSYVSPGQPDRSQLVYLLRGEDVPRRMPPDTPLPERDIELIERWILDGAECN